MFSVEIGVLSSELGPETRVFRCGLTVADVERVARRARTFEEAARKLGVGVSSLDRARKRYGLDCLFYPDGEVAFAGKRITVEELRRAAAEEPNKRAVARRLGVSERQLYDVAKRFGVVFQRRKPRPSLLTRRRILSLAKERLTRVDAAALAGVCYSHFKKRVKAEGVESAFPSHGEAVSIGRRGYAR